MPANAMTAKLLADARREFGIVRTKNRNLRLGRYDGRNNGGDATRNMHHATLAASQLPRTLEGLVWEEHRLAERISENRDAGNERPELRERVARVRREIRAAVAS